MPVSENREERREFFRVNFKSPVQFKSYSTDRTGDQVSKRQSFLHGQSQNISQSGILFQMEKNPPPISSILWMNVDLRTLNICKEIENRALIFNNGLLGKVVRVEEDVRNMNTYDVGVCFLTQNDKDSREVQSVLAEVSHEARISA